MTSCENVSRLLKRNTFCGKFLLNSSRFLYSSFFRCYAATAKKPQIRDEAMDQEVEFHSQLADQWWAENNALHAFNQLRVPFIRNNIGYTENLLGTDAHMNRILEGVKILDVGCGGGILSEALANLRANVVGIDPSGPLIDVAKKHAALDPKLNEYLKYERANIAHFSRSHREEFDAVVLSEVIEHVVNKEKLLHNAIECLKPNGSLFITAPSKTWLSKICIVTLAEMLNIVPKGTHDHRKFIKPIDLAVMLRKLNCPVKRIEGILYNPLTGKFQYYYTHQFMYAMHATKS